MKESNLSVAGKGALAMLRAMRDSHKPPQNLKEASLRISMLWSSTLGDMHEIIRNLSESGDKRYMSIADDLEVAFKEVTNSHFNAAINALMAMTKMDKEQNHIVKILNDEVGIRAKIISRQAQSITEELN